MEQHVFPLHHIHCHMGKTHIILHEIGHGNQGLDHLVHQQKLLSVLQVSFSQVCVRARVDGAALRGQNQGGISLTGLINKIKVLWKKSH